MIAKNSIKYYYICLISAVILLLSWNVLLANIDLINSNNLSMDERLIFNNIFDLINPSSIQNFIYNFSFGSDLRYGRLIYIINALFSYFPYKLYGNSGIIVTARFISYLLIIISIILIVENYLKSYFYKFFTYIALLFLPFSSYYTVLPKPEPFILLFLILFINSAAINKFKNGPYWIFLGLAFGFKISVLPILLISYILCYVEHKNLNVILNALVYTLLGFSFAIPSMLLHVLLIIFAIQIFKNLSLKINIRVILVSIILLISTYINRNIISTWFGSTFLNTLHGSDNENINFFSWINLVIDNYFINIYLFLIFIISLAIFIRLLYLQFKIFNLNIYPIFLFLLFGFFLIFPILITVKRLWGFYLYIGFIFIISAHFIAAENVFGYNLKCQSILILKKFIALHKITFFGFYGLIISSLWIPENLHALHLARHRSFSLEYLNQEASINIINSYLDSFSRKVSINKYTIYFDPTFFTPQKQSNFNLIYVWGVFSDWSIDPEFIIMNPNKIVTRLIAEDEYNFYSCPPSAYASNYFEVFKLPNGGVILLKCKYFNLMQ